MARSLQDQLLRAGLVDKKKAAQLEQEKRKQSKQQPKPPKGQSAASARRDQQQAEKAARDRELNLERQRQAERKALTAQVEQMIKEHRVSTTAADLDFRFVDRGVIKTIALNPAQQAAVVQGQLAIVRYRRVYALVPKAIAGKISERDASAVIVLNDSAAAAPGDEAEYAEFKVPDDLQW